MKFEQFSFDPRVLSAINEAGYTTPTPIQEKAIPKILNGHDVLAIAQTGTGKTAAFILPIIQQFNKTERKRYIRALILAPTRELAQQIYQNSIDLGKSSGIRSIALYGGVSKRPQKTEIAKGVDIVVACPGRLLDLLSEKALDLSRIETLVLDEADQMCDMGFLPDIKRILKILPGKRQTLFFSATMPVEIRTLADRILKNPVTAQVNMNAPAKTVSHALYPAPASLKKKLLLAVVENTPSSRMLIFTRTKYRARGLALDLKKAGLKTAALQGNMSQSQRLAALNGFRSGKYDILVATDIAARGIDVSEISHVINFDMPGTIEAYTHRIGRTGRALQTGEAFTLVTPEDEPMVKRIERVLGERIARRKIVDFSYTGA